MDEDIKVKQAYLKDNILPGNFQNFVQFCDKVVGNIDIETWTMDFVKELVAKFDKQGKHEPIMPIMFQYYCDTKFIHKYQNST